MKKILIILIISLILISGCIQKEINKEQVVEEIGSNQEIKENISTTKEEVKPEIKLESCDGWNDFKINNSCCKATKEVFLCGQDVDVYKNKLESAKKVSWDTAKEIIHLDNPKLSFQQPEGWKVMKDYYAGPFYVPISYFSGSGDSIQDTYEIRLLYYDKGDKNLEQIKEAIYHMVSKRQILRYNEEFHFYKPKQTWIDKAYWGIIDYYWDVWEQKDTDSIYYDFFIYPYKDKFYIWMYRDWSNRDYTGSTDKRYDGDYVGAISTTFYIEGTDYNELKTMQDDYVYYYALNFKKPTKIKYNLTSENNMHVYFVKEYKDFEKYAMRGFKDEKRFNFYTNCTHKSMKIAEGTCEITTGGLLIDNREPGFNNVSISLNWS